MDVLVVVGDGPVPERILARAHHVVRATAATPDVVADLRTRIPREVGVVGGAGANDVAAELHAAGLPVTLYADEAPTSVREAGIEVRAIAGPSIDAVDSLLDLIGDTPLVRLDRIGRELACTVVAKLEFFNPGGSVKDRVGIAMVLAAERDGRLQPGGTIIEPTSGNTGVGLAIVAARRRYRCIFTMPDKMSAEKIDLLRAYGAEVVVCPTAVPPEHPDSYYSVAKRLAEEIPGAFRPNQYENQENPRAHELSTGPEIWRQTDGRITHFVAGVGTGGTITGTGRYLKAQNPDVVIVGADPEGSVYTGGGGRPYLVEGIGEDFWPTTFDPKIVDRFVKVSDRDSFLTARRVTREEGILVGGSAGTAVHAALVVGRELGPDDLVVVLIPDSGRGYISKLYNDDWLADHGFLKSGGQIIGDILQRKGARIPELVHVHPDESVRSAIALLREFDVSQLPVIKAEPPLAIAEVAGSIRERNVMERVFSDPSLLDRQVADIMDPPLPTVGIGEPVDTAVAALDRGPAVLVVDAGHPIGILTRSDVLDFLTQRR